MNRKDTTIILLSLWTVCGVCALTPSMAIADGPVPELEASRGLTIERMQVGTDILDPAFDVYVNPLTIGRAYGSVDPVLLTDVALQLAEGERVLQRPRKAITARQALKLAVNAASQHHDNVSLERLAQFATLRQDQDLAAQIAIGRKLAAVTRDTSDRVMASVADVEVEQYECLKFCLRTIQQARLTGDARALVALESDLEITIPEPIRDSVRKQLADARASIPESDNDNEPLIRALQRLEAASRCDLPSCD